MTTAKTIQRPSIVCPECEMRTFNEHDISMRYCGACKEFHDELLARPIRNLRALVSAFYMQCFTSNVGSDAHAFIEWCGVMGEHVKLLANAAEAGVHARHVNEHCQTPIRVDAYSMQYLGEKLRCILGPFIDNNPEARAVLQKELFG